MHSNSNSFRRCNSFAHCASLRLCASALTLLAALSTFCAQVPSPTPADQRGIGVQSGPPNSSAVSAQQGKEAKPELVLQTGYSNFFGATRMVFSPDGRLLATSTFRSSSVKLWETATGRELRILSTGTQSSMSISPVIAFSRDGRLIAAASGNNSVKVWEVMTGREVQTVTGGQDSMMASLGVMAIAFTPDGRLVTVSDAVRVWDLASGRELSSLGIATMAMAGFGNGSSGVAVSPDGKVLAGADLNGFKSVIKLWDLASGKETKSINLSDHQSGSIEVSFATDGRLQIGAIVNKRLKLWDASGKERDLGSTTADYSLVKFSNEGRLVGLLEKYQLKLFETATGREVLTINIPNSGSFTSQGGVFASFSDDGNRIATGGFDSPTTLWESNTGKELLRLSGRTNMAYKVAFSADGNRLSSGGRTRWDLRTGRGLRITSASSDKQIGFPSPDGRLIASFQHNSNVLTILETPSGRVLHTLAPAGGGMVQRVVFSPDGAMVATTYSMDETQRQTPIMPGSIGVQNQVRIWDPKTGRELRSFTSESIPLEVGFSADGRTLATIGVMGQVSLWDTTSGSKLRDLTASPFGKLGNLGSMTGGVPNPGGRPSVASLPNMADLTAMVTTMMGTMSAGTMGRTVTSVAFSPDGRVVATGGVESKSNFDANAMMNAAMKQGRQKKQSNPQDFMKDMKVEAIGQVMLWDTSTGQEIGALKGHGKGVTQVAFSREGRLLASSGTDNTIKIWDVAAQKELRTMTGHNANIDSLAFSPDSKLLASASDDGGTFLWDTSSGEHLVTLISLDDGGEWMVVTPQGLFDGTPVSWNQILWRYNQDTFNVAPIEVFFNEFYYPGLLADIFAGKRPRVAQDVSKKDRRQPLVKLSVLGERRTANRNRNAHG